MGIENDIYKQGVDELENVIGFINAFNIPGENYAVDLTIARGLDYYTGTIYETVLDDYPAIGSVCSGGRYDNLAQNYTAKKLPGVGISIGLTRLFYQLRESGLIKPEKKSTPTMLLIIPMQGTVNHALEFSTRFREAGIPAEVYLNDGKMGKKFSYADKLWIPYVTVIGEDEIKGGKYKLKKMSSGEEEALSLDEIIARVGQGKSL
jgi:histidyl-tRNA synthetase